MADSAEEAANNGSPDDATTQRDVVPEAWDPHQVWLTRVKQPRDVRLQPSNPAPVKPASHATGSPFGGRSLRRA